MHFMLNLLIAMMRVFLFVLTFSAVMLQVETPSAQTPVPEIQVTSPLPGSALQGSVAINGSTDLTGFQSSEVSFSYPNGGPANWFLIQQSHSSVKGGILSVWDTSKIADGNYTLRVQVMLADGSKFEKIVADLRVRNYSAIETETPTPLQVIQITPVVKLTPTIATVTPQLTPTELPGNPAGMRPVELVFNMALGISFTVILFGLLGLYRWLRGKSH